MPFYRRRRSTRRRPLIRRRRRVMTRRSRRIGYLRKTNVHHFKRTFTGNTVISGTSAGFSGYGLTFDLLPNYTEFTALFDCYRINKILIKWVPNHNSSEMGSSAYLPEFYSVIDPTDASAPASLNEMYEYQTLKMTRGNQIHKRIWRPTVVGALKETNQTSAYDSQPKWRQWISTAQPDVLHYGIKFASGPTNSSGDCKWTPYVTYYFSCKSVK